MVAVKGGISFPPLSKSLDSVYLRLLNRACPVRVLPRGSNKHTCVAFFKVENEPVSESAFCALLRLSGN